MPQSIAGLIRDPYVLEFTGLAELPQYHESTLEAALPKAEEIQRLIENDRACWEQQQTGAKNQSDSGENKMIPTETRKSRNTG